MDILRRRKNPNKQIFMITDGKPTCLKIGKRYYKNSFGLDRKVTSRCLNFAAQCKKLKIPITTFMIATILTCKDLCRSLQKPIMAKHFLHQLGSIGCIYISEILKVEKKNSLLICLNRIWVD